MLTVTPAIDLRKGKVIRLFRGLYSKETIYSEDPLSIAMQWKDAGAQILHIIDLDGAFFGNQRNLNIIKKIINETGLKVHLGGGIRSKENIEEAIKAGVHKVIMSTKIFQDKSFLPGLEVNLQNRIIASIDSKSGIVLEKGWTMPTALSIQDALAMVESSGINTCVVTDVSLDGTMMGPNVEMLNEILGSTKMNIIAAGGMSTIEDVKTLRRIQDKHANLFGVIIGKALYEDKINLKEAIDCAK